MKGRNRGKTAEKDEKIDEVITFVLSCSFHRPVEYGSGKIAKRKSSPGARKTQTSDLSLKTTPFKITAVLKMFFSPLRCAFLNIYLRFNIHCIVHMPVCIFLYFFFL